MDENLTSRKHLNQLEKKIKVLEKVVKDNVMKSLRSMTQPSKSFWIAPLKEADWLP